MPGIGDLTGSGAPVRNSHVALGTACTASDGALAGASLPSAVIRQRWALEPPDAMSLREPVKDPGALFSPGLQSSQVHSAVRANRL